MVLPLHAPPCNQSTFAIKHWFVRYPQFPHYLREMFFHGKYMVEDRIRKFFLSFFEKIF